MPETRPRSGVFRRVLIYLGVAGPLSGDEVNEQDELEGDLRTIREILHWVVVCAAVVVSGALGDSWLERVIVLVLVVLVLGLLLRAFNAWALRRQREQRAST
jgi:hypothetical protein